MADDFADLLSAFVACQVRFLVVGAHALSVHGVPRATGDLDLWVDRDAQNAARIVAALERFGAPITTLGIQADDFIRPDLVAQLGLPPWRVDLLTTLDGVDFRDAWQDRVEAPVAGISVPVVSRATLIVNKRATGRLKDRVDLEALGDTG